LGHTAAQDGTSVTTHRSTIGTSIGSVAKGGEVTESRCTSTARVAAADCQ
jgi:hypothetical protein